MHICQCCRSRLCGLTCCVFGLVVVFISGCGPSGPPIAEVSGKVTYQGEPVTVGEVIFISDAGYGSSGSLRQDGSFSLVTQHGAGVPLGEYQVAITPPDPDDLPEHMDEMTFDNIPEKYHHFGSSGLTAVVEPGQNFFEFEMQ